MPGVYLAGDGVRILGADGAEAAGDPHRAGVGEARQPPGEHPGVELVGLAVHVDIGTGEIHRHHGKAAIAQMADQLVHERILGPAQRGEVDGVGGEKLARLLLKRSREIRENRVLDGAGRASEEARGGAGSRQAGEGVA